MELIHFKDSQECLEKLIELKVLSKTSKLNKLEELKYKQIVNGKVVEYKCNVLGFAFKNTKPKCHDLVYENLFIDSDNRRFFINTDYFTSMQKKGFGNDIENNE